MQDRLYQASPYNVIRLELNREEPGDADAGEPLHPRRRGSSRTGCARASSARTTTRRSTSTSRRSRSRARRHTRKGFLARVRLEPFGQGKIFPHEQTLSGPKADRLALYQATGFNLSPIFGLYPDADDEVLRAVEAGLRDRTPLEATDHLGVVNRLWLVDRPGDAHRRPGPDGRRSRSSSPTATTATRPA